MTKLIDWFKKRPSAQSWGWFATLWLGSLLAILALTSILKLILNALFAL